jgi:hypothetical protein
MRLYFSVKSEIKDRVAFLVIDVLLEHNQQVFRQRGFFNNHSFTVRWKTLIAAWHILGL